LRHPWKGIGRGSVEIQQKNKNDILVSYSLDFKKSFVYTFLMMMIFSILLVIVFLHPDFKSLQKIQTLFNVSLLYPLIIIFSLWIITWGIAMITVRTRMKAFPLFLKKLLSE